MKNNTTRLITLALILMSAVNSGAQLLPAADNTTYYYIQFRHNESSQLVVQDNGAGEILTVSARTINNNAQQWKVAPGTEEGSYIFTSKLGNSISWDAEENRFISYTSESSNISLLATNSTVYTYLFELQRQGSNLSMNVVSGVVSGNQIGESTPGDQGNVVSFIRAFEISSADTSSEFWYWMKSYRDNGKTINTNNQGANFDNSNPSSFRKLKLLKML